LPAHGFVAGLAERFRYWRERRRWIGEMANAASLDRVEAVLEDLGLTRSELDFLMNGPADAGRQIEALAEAAGVDLARLDAAALREAMWTCTRCATREACKRWLRGEGWQADGDSRCPNAALLKH